MRQVPLSPLEKVISEHESQAPAGRGLPQFDSRAPSSAPARKPGKAIEISPELMGEFVEAAKATDIPLNVLLGMGDKESGFDPKALGSETKYGTAKGIMQYLDGTSKGMKINPYSTKQSIGAAARQLRERLDKGYSLEEAIQEHFAGPDRSQWGPKTAEYGKDVLARAALYENAGPTKTETAPENAPENAPEGGYTAEQAQALLEEANAKEPGRYQIATPEQIAEFEAKNGGAMLPEDSEDEAFPDGKKEPGKDGFLSATGKSLKNIPGNFKEAGAGLVRSIGEGIDDQTLVSQAANAGVVDALRESGVITMKPSKTGMKGQDVPTLPNGKEATVSELAAYIRQNSADLLTGEDGDLAEMKKNALTMFGEKYGKEARKNRLEVNPDGPLAKYGSMIISSTAEMVPALLAGAVTKNPGLTLGLIGGQSKGASYERGREKGLNPDEAAAYATAQAMAEAIPSALPVHAILKPGGKFFTGLFTAAAAESLQEGVTAAIQAGIDQGTIDPNMTWGEAGQRILDGMIVGAGAGASLRAGFDGVPRAKEALKSNERKLGEAMNDAVDSAEFSTDAADIARQSLDPGNMSQQTGEGQPVDLQARREAEAAELQLAAAEQEAQAQAQAAPAGPLARAAATIRPKPEEAPPAPTASPLESAIRPDAGTDAFIGEPGSMVTVNIEGLDPFRAKLEGYVDGDAMLVDANGEYFQMSREDLANSTNEGGPSIETGKEQIDKIAEAVAEIETAVAEAEADQKPAPKKEEPKETGMAADDLTPHQRNQLRERGVTDEQLGEMSTKDATEALAKPVEQAKKSLEEMSGEELRAELKAVARQAKNSGGWNKAMIAERRKIEAEIYRKEAPAEPAKVVEDAGKANKAEDLAELKGMAKGMGDSLRDHLWSRFQAGKVNEQDGGNPTMILQAAKRLRNAGALDTRAEFDAMAEAVTKAAEGKTGEVRNSAIRAELGRLRDERRASDKAKTASEPAKTASEPVKPASKPAKTETPAAKPAPAEPAAPKPKGSKVPDTPHANRAERQLGTVGDTVTFSADVGYASGGKPFKIESIQRDGTAHVSSPSGSTTISRGELSAAMHRGVQITKTPAPKKWSEPVGKRKKEWELFEAETGTKGIPRSEMPQIQAEHRGAMVNFLNARDIAHTEATVPADSLKPTQAEYSPAKVAKALAREGGDRAILVSKDGHVVDGHHQWLAAMEKGEDVRVIRLDAPVEKVLGELAEFPSMSVESDTVTPGQVDQKAKPTVSENKVFTESAADAARALLKSKLGTLNSGVDPAVMQAGITLAGYHIEKGARTFAAYAKEMTKDLGDMVRPYLKSWYMGVKYDPRASEFEGMDAASVVEAFDTTKPIAIEETPNVPSASERVERNSQLAEVAEPGDAGIVRDAGRADAGDAGKPGPGTGKGRDAGQRDKRVPADGAAAGGKQSDNRVHRPDGEFQLAERATRGNERDGSARNSAERSPVSRKRAKQVAENAGKDGTGELGQRLKAQREADGTPTKWGDKDSIDAALPLLLPAQRNDVLKGEQRFAEHNGMLYTNGTGTGKTATGTGLMKRFINDGKPNGIVIVPTDKIASDWVKFGKMMGIDVHQLDGLHDNGTSGPVVTTYANFGNNASLAQRQFDWIIPDESHYLSSNAEGGTTEALDQLRALTGHHAGFEKWLRTKYVKPYQKLQDAYRAMLSAEHTESMTAEDLAKVKADHFKASKDWEAIRKEQQPKWMDRWEKQENIPKVAFLSATPFAYAKSTDYAEGFLFHYTDPANIRKEAEGGRSYNAGDARQRFMMENFGYRMRYNKLTAPEAGVDSQVMEQQFNTKLKNSGALSGRRLEVPFDYDRRFITAEDAIGTKIDDALRYLREGEGGKYREVFDAVNSSFDFQSRQYLLEALKARAVVPMIQADLAAGRKVAVFHDYNKGGGVNPFAQALQNIRNPLIRDKAREVLSQPMFKMDLSGLKSPIDTLSEAFPGLLQFNGTISKANRRRNADTFNDDDKGPNVILLQSDAGREGVSLHDTSGKHQRVLYNLGMPTKPVSAIQIEGRTYRTGQASDAMFRYLTTGTGWESSAFSSKIAERASTAENLALGEEARNLRTAFVDAYNEASPFADIKSGGKGGKQRDRDGAGAVSPFDQAKSFYWAGQKNSKARKLREGTDYYATAEPVAFKKVEWAGIRPGDRVLEPSAGHGAISRFFPKQSDVTMIEPSYDLSQRAALSNVDGRVVNDTFESHHLTNKYESIVMNPPFGAGGKTAIEHLAKAARHLSEGGRIVATIPRGGMADRRLDAFLADPASANLHTVADIELPGVAFERAGTGVATRVLILDKVSGDYDGPSAVKVDLSNATTAKELFDRIESLEMPPRPDLATDKNSLIDDSGTDGNSFSAESLGDHLRQGELGDVIGQLIDSGRVVVHDTAPKGVHYQAQGWTDKNGTINLAADKLTADTALPVLLHEAFHAGGRSILDTPRWTNLMGRLNGFYKAAEAGRMPGQFAEGFRRVQAAIESGDTMSRLTAIEEMGAYAIENYAQAPAGVRKWVDGVVGAIKDWLLRKTGMQFGDVTPAQLRSLAAQVLRQGKTQGRDMPANSFRRGPTNKEVDGWFSRKMTDAMAGPKSSGQWSLLALAPMDRMIEELGGSNVHAKEYMNLKRDMDAYRASKHREYDNTAQKWMKLKTKYGQAEKDMSVLMHDSTIAQLDPSKPFPSKVTDADRLEVQRHPNSQRSADIMAKMAEEDAKSLEHAELVDRFNKLPAELQQHYKDVRDTYQRMTEELDTIIATNLSEAMDIAGRRAERVYDKEMQDIIDDGLTGQDKIDAEAAALKKYNTASTKHRMNKKARMTQLRQQFEANRLEGPYFPLARFGGYTVTVRDPATGKVLSFSRFESRKEQQAFEQSMKGKGAISTGLLDTKSQEGGGIDPRFVADVEEILQGSSVPDAVKDQVWQRYLESMPDMSMRKGFIHRKNREGYTQDAARAFANRMFHGSHQLGRLKYGAKMQEAMEMAGDYARKTDTPERDTAVVNEITKRHDYVMNPKGGAFAQKLTSAAFIYQLSMSPAAALVNMTQTVMLGVPIIGQKFGMGNTIAEMGKAAAAFVGGKGHAKDSSMLNADEKKAMDMAYENGVIESSQSHSLAGVGDGVGVEYNALRTKVMGVIAWMFHQTERVNREVTFLAAYRLAKKSGLDQAQAVTEATALTYKTHFDYANTNRPRAMHGDAAKVALVFRNYQVNMLWRLFRDTHQAFSGEGPARNEAIKQLSGITGMMALHAGVRGTWLYGIGLMIAGLIFGDDAEEKFKKATVETLGPTAGGMLLNGVPGHLSGTALSGRIGMPDLWFRSPDRQLEGKDEFQYWQSQLLGFLPSIAQNAFVGAKQAGDGDIYRGIETAAPKSLKDIMRAYRYGTEGVKNMKGESVVEDLTPGEIFAQAMGFTPAVVAEQYERNSALKNAEQRIKDQRRKLMDKFAVAHKTKDQDLREKTLAGIKEFNDKNKAVAIKPANLQQSVQGKAKRSQRTEGGVYIDPKLNKQLRDNLGPAIYK